VGVRPRTVPINEHQLYLDMSGIRLDLLTGFGLAESTWGYVVQNSFKTEKLQICDA
jgi:hypothetical protein